MIFLQSTYSSNHQTLKKLVQLKSTLTSDYEPYAITLIINKHYDHTEYCVSISDSRHDRFNVLSDSEITLAITFSLSAYFVFNNHGLKKPKRIV